jgi:Amidohydrolase family
VVKAARLIDGRGGPPLEPAMVRIAGERIEEVAAAMAVAAGATLIDLGSATLLPGLIDLHTHLTDRDDVHCETAPMMTTPPEAALWGARNARVTLMAGFTTCRHMGPTWPYVDGSCERRSRPARCRVRGFSSLVTTCRPRAAPVVPFRRRRESVAERVCHRAPGTRCLKASRG